MNTLAELFAKTTQTNAQATLDMSFQWRWAFEHPYLYTFIKVGTPSLYAIIMYIGFRIITRAFARK